MNNKIGDLINKKKVNKVGLTASIILSLFINGCKKSDPAITPDPIKTVEIKIPEVNQQQSDTLRIGVVRLPLDNDNEYKRIFGNIENKKKLEQIISECGKQLGIKYIKLELFDILDENDQNTIIQANAAIGTNLETGQMSPRSTVGAKIRIAIDKANLEHIKKGETPIIGYSRFLSSSMMRLFSDKGLKGASSYTLGGINSYASDGYKQFIASTGVPYYPNLSKFNDDQLVRERGQAFAHEVFLHTLANNYPHPTAKILVNKQTGEYIFAEFTGLNSDNFAIFADFENGKEYISNPSFQSKYNILSSYVSGAGGYSPSNTSEIIEGGSSIKNPYAPFNTITGIPQVAEKGRTNGVANAKIISANSINSIYQSAYERYKTQIKNGRIGVQNTNTDEQKIQKEVMNVYKNGVI